MTSILMTLILEMTLGMSMVRASMHFVDRTVAVTVTTVTTKVVAAALGEAVATTPQVAATAGGAVAAVQTRAAAATRLSHKAQLHNTTM